MALQGTLDTFELPDVLRLLASTKKTGRLILQGDRGDGSVWLADGQVTTVQTTASPDGQPADGLFDLLRAREGGFAFEPGAVPEHAGPTHEVEPLLVATEQRLGEWREIEAVVPSLHAWVALVPELPRPEVTVDVATWRLVATIGSGLTVGDLGRSLDLDEVAVCRVVRDLVVLGLGAVTDAPAPAAAAAPAAAWEPAVAEPMHGMTGGNGVNGVHGQANGSSFGSAFDEAAPAAADYRDLPSFGMDEAPAPAAAGWDDYPVAEPAAAPMFAVEEPAAYRAPLVEHGAEPAPLADAFVDDDADEVARQLAMLSPRAAQAVAAAAAADSDDERDAHLDAIDDSEEPINRGLLLKFLSSVKN